MRDESEELYRFGCPACGQVLKAARRMAGGAGMCPACEADIVFPQMLAADSWTLRQVMEVVGGADQPVEEETLDRVGLLLAQGTCLDYTMGREQLPERMAARRWRRLLVLAGSRELIRLDILWKMEGGGEVEEVFRDHASAAAGQAWTVMARYLHFNRHGMCKECRADRTGMGCVYQSFERFLEAARWDEERSGKWARALEQALGVKARRSHERT